jgi:hypothetical protein
MQTDAASWFLIVWDGKRGGWNGMEWNGERSPADVGGNGEYFFFWKSSQGLPLDTHVEGFFGSDASKRPNCVASSKVFRLGAK